jgi:hypothetical protein
LSCYRKVRRNPNRMPPLLTYGEALRCTAEITRRSETEVAAEFLALQASGSVMVAEASDVSVGRVPAPALVWTAERFLADRDRAALSD